MTDQQYTINKFNGGGSRIAATRKILKDQGVKYTRTKDMQAKLRAIKESEDKRAEDAYNQAYYESQLNNTACPHIDNFKMTPELLAHAYDVYYPGQGDIYLEKVKNLVNPLTAQHGKIARELKADIKKYLHDRGIIGTDLDFVMLEYSKYRSKISQKSDGVDENGERKKLLTFDQVNAYMELWAKYKAEGYDLPAPLSTRQREKCAKGKFSTDAQKALCEEFKLFEDEFNNIQFGPPEEPERQFVEEPEEEERLFEEGMPSLFTKYDEEEEVRIPPLSDIVFEERKTPQKTVPKSKPGMSAFMRQSPKEHQERYLEEQELEPLRKGPKPKPAKIKQLPDSPKFAKSTVKMPSLDSDKYPTLSAMFGKR